MNIFFLMGLRKPDDDVPACRAGPCWRRWLLALLLVLLLGFIGWLFWLDTPRATRAGLVLGGTLVGMLALAARVCRK